MFGVGARTLLQIGVSRTHARVSTLNLRVVGVCGMAEQSKSNGSLRRTWWDFVIVPVAATILLSSDPRARYAWFGLAAYSIIVILRRLFSRVKKRRLRLSLSAGSAIILVFVWIILARIFAEKNVKARIIFTDDGQSYAFGTVVSNVIFEPEFSDLRTKIENSTDDDFSDLDLDITTDEALSIIDAGEVTDFGGCVVIAPKSLHTEQVDVGGKTLAHTILQPNWPEKHARIRCSKVPKHSTVELILATAALNNPSDKFLYRRQPPTVASAKGDFSSGGKRYLIDETLNVEHPR
jgi:hypothetical protein